MPDKEIAVAALDKKSKAATLDETGEERAILAALQRGNADIEAGRTVSQEEVKQRSATWNSN